MAHSVSIPRISESQKSHDLSADGSTPPDKHIPLLLTPPATDERRCQTSDVLAVENVMRLFKNCGNHGLTGPHAVTRIIELSPYQYYQSMKKLGNSPSLKNYIQDKVRYDYDPQIGVLYFRMPTPVHDFFATSVAGEINKQLRSIVERGNVTGDFAAQIENGGSSRIILREGITGGDTGDSSVLLQHQPDAQFQHRGAAYPGIVLEVSYSQDGKNLKKLASDYVLYSNGDIKVVVGIDISYGTKESTLSLWRPCYIHEEGEEEDILEVRQEVEYQPFRDSDGSSVNQELFLCFNLSDFATDEISTGYEYELTKLRIPYERLAKLLNKAEQMHQARESNNGGQSIKSKRRTRKRKRSSSPADQITTEDEAEHRRQENEATERAALKDKEFELPWPKRRGN